MHNKLMKLDFLKLVGNDKILKLLTCYDLGFAS